MRAQHPRGLARRRRAGSSCWSAPAPRRGWSPLHVWLPPAHAAAPGARLGADVRRDDQGRALRDDPRAVRPLRPGAAAMVGGAAAGCWARGGAVLGALRANIEADIKAMLACSHRRECRADRDRPRHGAGGAGGRPARPGGAGDGRRAAARHGARDVQVAAVPRRRRGAAWRRHAAAGPARRPDPPHAGDHRLHAGGCRLPGRPAAELRLRQRVDCCSRRSSPPRASAAWRCRRWSAWSPR